MAVFPSPGISSCSFSKEEWESPASAELLVHIHVAVNVHPEVLHSPGGLPSFAFSISKLLFVYLINLDL